MQIFKVSIIWEGEPNGRLLSRLQNQTRICIVNYYSVANFARFFFEKLGPYFVNVGVNNYLNMNILRLFCWITPALHSK